MEKELEPFTDEEYEPREIGGRMMLWLHGTEYKRKKVEVEKIPRIYEAMREGWDVYIRHAVMDGGIDISKADLETDDRGKYIIAGYVSFMGDSFQDMSFSGASFTQGGDFIEASFTQNMCFIEASFQDALFRGASFQDVSFMEASFPRTANFRGASFTQTANFGGASFARTADFSGASFIQGADFSGASFIQGADFSGARLKYPAIFSGVSLRENTVWRGLWNYLLRSLFWPLLWLFTIGKIRLPKAEFTNILDINTNTVMDTSSNPRLKRYIDDEQWINSWRSNPKWRRLRQIPFWIWEVTSHCGRSIGLWAFWSVLVAVLFAFVYQAFGSGSITFSVYIGQEPNFKRYLYYSVVTFTTLGFGDIIPKTDWARLAVGAEVVLGYVMLGGLISIFANKFARRS